eukprot:Rhum_TRINITY_DN4321_c0_g2::Rhum_TRINITY_DN4321_c0_g2_i1::g.13899::m.13899
MARVSFALDGARSSQTLRSPHATAGQFVASEVESAGSVSSTVPEAAPFPDNHLFAYMRPLYRHWLTGAESAVHRSQKLLMLSVLGVSVLLSSLSLVGVGISQTPVNQYVLALIMVMVTASGGILHMFATKTCSQTMMHATLAMLCLEFALMDLHSAALSQRLWPILLCLCNTTLGLRMPSRSTTAFILGSAVWLVLICAEQIWRFGLFDLPLSPERTERMKLCCANPPCAPPMQSLNGTANIAVLLINLFITKSFANALERETNKVELSVKTVHEVADCLARFDLDEASVMLDHLDVSGDMPSELRCAFLQILGSLKDLRPYLPYLPTNGDESGNADDAESSQSNTQLNIGGEIDLLVNAQAGRSFVMRSRPRARLRNMTSVVTNLHDFIGEAERDTETMGQAKVTKILEIALDTFQPRGIVDLFLGDHVFVSYNASRQCARHASLACEHAKTFWHCVTNEGIPSNVAIATGKALQGDMGCDDMRRHSVVGVLPVIANGLERAGRALDVSVLCSLPTFSDAQHDHELRMVLRRVGFVKDHAGTLVPLAGEQFVWEVVLGQGESNESPSRAAAEWMYELEVGAGSVWAEYNDAAKSFLRDEPYQEYLSRCSAVVSRLFEEQLGNPRSSTEALMQRV